jgi:hypothetical protein
MSPIELERQSRSERQPDHVRVLESQSPDKRSQNVCIVRQTEARVRIGRTSAAGRIPGNDGEVVRKILDLP